MKRIRIGKRVGTLAFNMNKNEDELKIGTIVAKSISKPRRWLVSYEEGDMRFVNEDCIFLKYNKKMFKEAK